MACFVGDNPETSDDTKCRRAAPAHHKLWPSIAAAEAGSAAAPSASGSRSRRFLYEIAIPCSFRAQRIAASQNSRCGLNLQNGGVSSAIIQDIHFALTLSFPYAIEAPSFGRIFSLGLRKMEETSKVSPEELLRMTTEVAAAYVSNNTLAAAQLADVIRTIHGSLTELNGNGTVAQAEPPVPAVPIKKSVMPDYIICLEDGKKLKMLKRHLRSTYNMTPEEYRARWNLPADYPMVAPNYAAQRSAFAKKIGLGRTPGPRGRRARAKK
jgi:predicted transcriptional regulator